MQNTMPYIDTLKTIRVNAGIRIVDLAKASGLDRGTISRVEKHYSATPETLNAIINTLNKLYYRRIRSVILYDDVVTKVSRYGGNS